ncbi:MAG: acyl-CoA dehydrogenase family protein [Chloroflexota bacterium]
MVLYRKAARRAADDAVQIHGAYGWLRCEYNVERHLRNSSAVIYEGTSQIHS